MRVQLCPTLCEPKDCSPPGSSVHGISPARLLEWVVNFCCWGSSQPRDRTHICIVGDSLPLSHLGSPQPRYMRVCVLSCFRHVRLVATLWTIAHQAALSMGFPRQEYWSGLPCSPPGDLPNPGIEPANAATPALQADSLPLSHWGSPHPR